LGEVQIRDAGGWRHEVAAIRGRWRKSFGYLEGPSDVDAVTNVHLGESQAPCGIWGRRAGNGLWDAGFRNVHIRFTGGLRHVVSLTRGSGGGCRRRCGRVVAPAGIGGEIVCR
jgi:hypothetical protein